MAVPLVIAGKLALQAAIPFFKKHPWVLPTSLIASVMVLIFAASFIFGTIQGFGNIKFYGKSCENSELFSADKFPDGVRNLGVDEIAEEIKSCDSTGGLGEYGLWYMPSTGTISSFFGPRSIVCGGTGCSVPFHAGLDFAAVCGTPIVAASNGVVKEAKNAGAFGWRVIIEHAGGVESRYGHLQSYSVKAGDIVQTGQQIGATGKSGVATGCHLDLKIFINGVEVNPAIFLFNQGVNVINLNGAQIDYIRSTNPVGYQTAMALCVGEMGKNLYYCPGGLPRNQTPPPPTGAINPPTGTDGAKKYAMTVVAQNGWSNTQYLCLEKLWEKESNWRVNAENKSSGAYGIPQALPGSKMASAGADWKTNANTQINWGIGYIKGRYDTPCVAWSHSQAKNWY